MTTISVHRSWTNSASESVQDQRGIQFTSSSSTYEGFDYAARLEGDSLPALLWKGVRNISATAAISASLMTLTIPAMASAALATGATTQATRIFGSRSEDRKAGLEDLADEIRSFFESPHLEDQTAMDTIRLAARDALSFMQIVPLEIDLPSATYSDDGEIVILWANGNKRAELAFPGTGELGYAFLNGEQFVPGNEKGDPSIFPKDLLNYLRA